MPRIKSATSSNPSTLSSQASQPSESPYYIWPPSSRGEVVLDEKKYSKGTETLLRLDFANQDLAEDSTKTWIEEIAVLAGLSDSWGQTVTGHQKLCPATTGTQNGGHATTMLVTKKRKPDPTAPAESGVVNTLGVKKKPKLENPPMEANDSRANGTGDGINTLSSDLVRKKPKVQPEAIPAAGIENGINVMSGGLVKKKPEAA